MVVRRFQIWKYTLTILNQKAWKICEQNMEKVYYLYNINEHDIAKTEIYHGHSVFYSINSKLAVIKLILGKPIIHFFENVKSGAYLQLQIRQVPQKMLEETN